jgi:DNA-binding beta-propeller fold protein YncE
MKGRYRTLTFALILGVTLLAAWFVVTIAAQELTPPYVVATVDTGTRSHPQTTAVDTARGYAYILDELGKLWIFQGTEITEVLNIGSQPNIGVDPGGYAYVTSNAGDPIRIIEGTTALPQTVDLGNGTGKVETDEVAVLPTNHYAYVLLPEDDKVAVLQGTTVLHSGIPVGDNPTDVAVNPMTGLVYVVNQNSNNVSVLSGLAVTETISVGTFPSAVDVDPTSGYVYVSNSLSNTISVLQGTVEVAVVPVGEAPGEISVNPSSGRAYVINTGSQYDPGSLSVLDGPTHVTDIDVGEYPRAIDVDPLSGYIYVVGGLGSGGTVAVVSDTLLVETFLPVGHSPRDVAVDPYADRGLGYVSLYQASGGRELGQVVIMGRTLASQAVIDPDDPTPTQMTCQALNDLTVEIFIPAGAFTETTTLLCTGWEPSTGPDYVFAGQGFLLKAYRNGQYQPGLAFEKSITLAISYPAPLPVNVPEDELLLRVRDSLASDWTTEGMSAPQFDFSTDLVTTTVTRLPELAQDGYALIAPKPSPNVYLPLIMRRSAR